MSVGQNIAEAENCFNDNGNYFHDKKGIHHRMTYDEIDRVSALESSLRTKCDRCVNDKLRRMKGVCT